MPELDKPRLILVEDDEKLSKVLCQYFNKHDYDTLAVLNGSEAPGIILKEKPDLVILDLMLPGKDGLTVCREVRPGFDGKIMMLTANDDDMDQVAALEMGVDDYVTKPIKPRVLLARLRMLLRRDTPKATPTAIVNTDKTKTAREKRFGQLHMHQSLRECHLGEEFVALTSGEFDLLWLLASSPDQIFSRDELTHAVRGIEYDGLDRTVDNRIASLRKKLGDSSQRPKRIVTVRGKGYLFVADQW